MGYYSNFTKDEVELLDKKGIQHSDWAVFFDINICEYIKWVQIIRIEATNEYSLFVSHKEPFMTYHGTVMSDSSYNCFGTVEATSLDNLLYQLMFDKALQKEIATKMKQKLRREILYKPQSISADDFKDMLLPFSDDGFVVKNICDGFINESCLDSLLSATIFNDSDIYGYVAKIIGNMEPIDINYLHLSEMVLLFGYKTKLVNKGVFSYIICYKIAKESEYLPNIS